MRTKKIMFLARHADSVRTKRAENLEAALITAAFGQEVHLAFVDDGVYQLLPTPNGGQALETLGEYDIDHLWVDRDSLATRGLDVQALAGQPTAVDTADLAKTMSAMDIVVSV